MTLETEAASTASRVKPSPASTAAVGTAASRISCTNSKATPAIATAEPAMKRTVTRSPKNARASSALGTTSSANTTAARPEVM